MVVSVKDPVNQAIPYAVNQKGRWSEGFIPFCTKRVPKRVFVCARVWLKTSSSTWLSYKRLAFLKCFLKPPFPIYSRTHQSVTTNTEQCFIEYLQNVFYKADPCQRTMTTLTLRHFLFICIWRGWNDGLSHQHTQRWETQLRQLYFEL